MAELREEQRAGEAALRGNVVERLSSMSIVRLGRIFVGAGIGTCLHALVVSVAVADAIADHTSADPNSVTTANTYDLMPRLLSTIVGGQTTGYEYDPVGQLLKVTLPGQSWANGRPYVSAGMTARKT